MCKANASFPLTPAAFLARNSNGALSYGLTIKWPPGGTPSKGIQRFVQEPDSLQKGYFGTKNVLLKV